MLPRAKTVPWWSRTSFHLIQAIVFLTPVLLGEEAQRGSATKPALELEFDPSPKRLVPLDSQGLEESPGVEKELETEWATG